MKLLLLAAVPFFGPVSTGEPTLAMRDRQPVADFVTTKTRDDFRRCVAVATRRVDRLEAIQIEGGTAYRAGNARGFIEMATSRFVFDVLDPAPHRVRVYTFKGKTGGEYTRLIAEITGCR